MQLLELIQRVCFRPRMHVGSDVFHHFALVLEGYDWAVDEFGSDAQKAVTFTEFGRWLSGTHENEDMMWILNGKEVEANLAWPSKFQRLYPIDRDAFDAFPGYYERFLNDVQSGAWPPQPE